MALRRRTFLQSIGSAAAAATIAPGIGIARSSQATFSVLINTVGTEVWDERHTILLRGFVQNSLPVGVIHDFGRQVDGGPNLPAALAAEFLANPQLVELVAWNGHQTDPRGYFQMRQASEAAGNVQKVFVAGGGGLDLRLQPVSIASLALSVAVGLNGYRVAGFRNAVLVPEASRRTTDGGCGGPVTCASGGLHVPFSITGRDFVQLIADEARSSDHFNIFLDGADGSAPADDLGGALAAAAEASARPILPRDRIFSLESNAGRWLALCLVVPPRDDTAMHEGFMELAQRLAELTIEFSVVAPADWVPDGISAEVIPLVGAAALEGGAWQGDAAGAFPPGLVATSDRDMPAKAAARAGIRHVLHVGASGPLPVGVDTGGVNHLPVLGVLDSRAGQDLMGQFGPYREGALIVPADAYATRAGRNAIFAILREAYQSPSERIMGAARFAAEMLPPSPIYELMMETEARHDPMQPETMPRPEPELEVLLEDARKAWSYFSTFADAKTALPPATIFADIDYSSHHNTLTMWDTGSIVFGLLSAVRLGLVGGDEARDRADKIVQSLARATRTAGIGLPPAEFDSRYPWVVKRDYNSCDTGRLLSALSALKNSPIDPGGVDELVSSWDLRATVTEGRVHSKVNGRLVRSSSSHCAHYTSKALGGWGIAAISPYDEAFSAYTGADARMNLLHRAGQFGPIGAEPLLLEAVEFGLSETTEYLSEVLFSAQAAAHEATGAIYCVSEGPIPEEPWFTYQGLDLANRSQEWKVTTILNLPTYRSDKFQRANLMISSKAAYLWAACHPHAYSSKLVAYVRARARRDAPGFAAGIYAASQKPTDKYTDANTNGIILQAIAEIFRQEGVTPPPAEPPAEPAP